jgi:hypothetical protein
MRVAYLSTKTWRAVRYGGLGQIVCTIWRRLKSGFITPNWMTSSAGQETPACVLTTEKRQICYGIGTSGVCFVGLPEIDKCRPGLFLAQRKIASQGLFLGPLPPHTTRTANPGADPSPRPRLTPINREPRHRRPRQSFFQQRVRAAVALGTRFVANATVLSAGAYDVEIKVAIRPIGQDWRRLPGQRRFSRAGFDCSHADRAALELRSLGDDTRRKWPSRLRLGVIDLGAAFISGRGW